MNITFTDFDTGTVDPSVKLSVATISGVQGSVRVGSPGRTGGYSLQLTGPYAQAGWPILTAPVSVSLRFDFLPPTVGIVSSDIAQIQTANNTDIWPTLRIAPITSGGYTLTVTGSGLASPAVVRVTFPGWHQLQLLVDRVHHTVSFGVDNVIQGPYAYSTVMGQPLFATLVNNNEVVGLRGDGLYSEMFSFDNILIGDGSFDPITYSFNAAVLSHGISSEHNSNPARYTLPVSTAMSGVATATLSALRTYTPVAVAKLSARGATHLSRSFNTLAHGVVGIIHGHVRRTTTIAVTAHGTVGSMVHGAGTRLIKRRKVGVGVTGSPRILKHPFIRHSTRAQGLANVTFLRRYGRTVTDNLAMTDIKTVSPRVEPITIPTVVGTATIPLTLPTEG
jgi:hypothetical protein